LRPRHTHIVGDPNTTTARAVIITCADSPTVHDDCLYLAIILKLSLVQFYSPMIQRCPFAVMATASSLMPDAVKGFGEGEE